MSFNHVTEADLKYFRELLPGRVFSGEIALKRNHASEYYEFE